MNFVKKISSRALSALDFGADSVVALIGEKKDGAFRLLGAGNAPAAGVRQAAVVHTGDAVEAILEAVGNAERSAGLKTDRWYYNFDDVSLAAARTRGSKSLAGEGQITQADVDDACRVARRLMGRFERVELYARPVNFVIDDRDTVSDPLGVFGRKLDAEMVVLTASAEQAEDWRKVMRRAGIGGAVPVVSSWSTAYAVIPAADRQRRWIIADAGRDLVAISAFHENRIEDLRIFATPDAKELPAAIASAAHELLPAGKPEAVLITGDLADAALEEAVGALARAAVRSASPIGIARLEEPRYASAAGLLWVADELERKSPILNPEKGLMTGLRQKAAAFINDYF